MSHAAGDRATSTAWCSVVGTRWDLAEADARGFDDARSYMCACALEARLFMRGAWLSMNASQRENSGSGCLFYVTRPRVKAGPGERLIE